MMNLNNKFKTLILNLSRCRGFTRTTFILAVLLGSVSANLTAQCDPPLFDPDAHCNDLCPPEECLTADENTACQKCIDMTAVPELPDWFGPFFLATLVAGWEYWRVQKRKKAKLPVRNS